MSAESLTEEQRAQRLRQRLWGATILIAIAVIVLPLLLDGSGSESQFRRVESLRQEPTRVINADGTRQTVPIPETNANTKTTTTASDRPRAAIEHQDKRRKRNLAPQKRTNQATNKTVVRRRGGDVVASQKTQAQCTILRQY